MSLVIVSFSFSDNSRHLPQQGSREERPLHSGYRRRRTSSVFGELRSEHYSMAHEHARLRGGLAYEKRSGLREGPGRDGLASLGSLGDGRVYYGDARSIGRRDSASTTGRRDSAGRRDSTSTRGQRDRTNDELALQQGKEYGPLGSKAPELDEGFLSSAYHLPQMKDPKNGDAPCDSIFALPPLDADDGSEAFVVAGRDAACRCESAPCQTCALS